MDAKLKKKLVQLRNKKNQRIFQHAAFAIFNAEDALTRPQTQFQTQPQQQLALSLNGDQLQLHIKHNGLALSQNDYEKFSQESDSLGLMNIRYRLHLINGKLHFSRSQFNGEILLNTTLTLL